MRVGIIDYGSGNIRSVFKSFEKAASLRDEIKKLDKEIRISS